jgi:putative spermidine/putrescine transport system ATP-binding protein
MLSSAASPAVVSSSSASSARAGALHNNFEELRLVNVTRNFGGTAGAARFAALRALSLTVRRGEFIALLGPSGCGKSTALNCIAGLMPLSSGSIWLDETRIDVLPPEKRGFGMVFQSYALFPHMTVRKNVGFGLLMRGVRNSEIRARVDHALGLVQLKGQADKLPGQLSGGQQQRVAIARAIVVEPALVLMDEPLSNLDAKLRVETRAEIRRIHRELGRATIYVTHDQDEALSLADRIVVLREGEVQQVAPPQEVYAQPANLHVARFMGYRNVIDLEASPTADPAQVILQGPGLRLFGAPRNPLTHQWVSAAIRPDDINVGTVGAVNTIPGRVENFEYCGRDSLIDVSIGGGISLHVRTSAPVALGDQVVLSIPPDRVLVYPREA